VRQRSGFKFAKRYIPDLDDSFRDILGYVQESQPIAMPFRMESLALSRVDMSLRDGRYLQYYSDKLGLSEVDLSEHIGNINGTLPPIQPPSLYLPCAGKLAWDAKYFHTTAVKTMLVNGHVLIATMYSLDGQTLQKSGLDLDTRIHCEEEILVYDEGRARYCVDRSKYLNLDVLENTHMREREAGQELELKERQGWNCVIC
jgi:hypothetical protein